MIKQPRAGLMPILAVFLAILVLPIECAQADEELWFTANSEDNGLPLVIRARRSAPDDIVKADYPQLVVVTWPYRPKNESGMPDSNTNSGQIDLEDGMMELDAGRHGLLMLVLTGNGQKEWFLYVSDFDDWIGRLNAVLRGHPVYPLEIVYEPDPGWSLHEAFVSSVQGLP